MKRYILFIIAVVFAAIGVNAQQISKEMAKQKASAFVDKTNPQMKQMLTLAYKAEKTAQPFSTNDEAYLYVFNRGFNQGFVIVSGDERTNDILGYCDHGSFDPNNLPPGFKYFLEEYENQIRYLQENNIQPVVAKATSAKENIGYLLKTTWNQNNPYNYYLNGCATGCVATALAQVMFHWKWPQDATATIPSYSNSGSVSAATLQPTTFDWSKMQNHYTTGDYTDNHEVAKLMKYVGHAVKMNYGAESGAYVTDIINAMTNYFGYPKDEQLLYRWALSATEWADTIYANLANSIPVIMCGSNSEGGHCFVCDGYEDGKYHINWGWGGSADGYYDLEVLVPTYYGTGASGSDGFTESRSIVTRIHNPSTVVPPTPEDSIPLAAESIFLFAGPQTLNREARANSVSGDLRYFIPVSSTITDTLQVDTLIIGLGCYDEGDNLVGIYNSTRRTFNSEGGYYYNNLNSIATEMPYGTYKFYPVWGDVIAGKWRKINGTASRYIQADVAEDGQTVTIAPSRGVSVSVSENKSGSVYKHYLTVTNIGVEPYVGELLVYCIYNSGGSQKAGYQFFDIAELGVGESQYFSVTDYTTTSSMSSGNTIVYVFQDYESAGFNEMLWTSANNATALSDFWTEAAWTGTYHLGNNLKFFVELQNDGHTSSTQDVKVTLFPKGGKVQNGTSQTKSVTIGPNTVASEEFDFPNLTYNKEYDIEISCNVGSDNLSCDTLSTIYKSYGVEYYIKPVKGSVVYGNESSYLMLDDNVDTWETIVEDAYFVDASNSEKATSLVPGTNPNTLYLLAAGTATPTKLEGKNVIIGTNCAELNIDDNYEFYSIIDFTAVKANYRRIFVNGNDGTRGNWETLQLPFDVNSVTKDDGATSLSWFTSKTEHGKNFWVYRFASEDDDNTVVFDYPTSATTLAAETPYIITVPAQSSKWGDKWVLTGKELTFSGENVRIPVTNKQVTTMGANKKFDFIGGTYPRSRNQIYYLNEAGTRFENTHTAWADIDPFRCYFVGYFNNDALTIKMRFGDNDTPTGIGAVTSDGDAPTAVAPSVYGLDGKALGDKVLPMGTYIVNGKKLMLKGNMPKSLKWK